MPAELYTVDISQATTGFSRDRQLTFFALQGVVNAQTPKGGTQIWISGFDGNLNVAPTVIRRADEQARWLSYYQSKFGLGAEAKTPAEVLQWAKDRGYCSKYIVFDPDYRFTINIGTTMAGLYRCVLIHPDDEATGLNLQGLGYTRYADLRNGYDGKWVVTPADYDATRVNGYTWAKDNLLPLCTKKVNHSLFCAENDGVFPTVRTDSARDYAIAAKSFTWMLPFEYLVPSPSLSIAKEIFSSYPPGAMVIGWCNYSELDYITAMSAAGHYSFAWKNTVNLSVHASIETSYDFKADNPWDYSEPDAVDPDKIYLTVNVCSDGPAICFERSNRADAAITGSAEEQMFMWLHPDRGKVPMDWMFYPEFYILTPGVMQYYYETRTPNDHFILGGPIGYMYPSVMAAVNKDAWKNYLDVGFRALSSVGAKHFGDLFDSVEIDGGRWGLTHNGATEHNPIIGYVSGGQVTPITAYGVGDQQICFCGGKPIIYAGVLSSWFSDLAGPGSQVWPGTSEIIRGIKEYAERHASQRPLFIYCMIVNWDNILSEVIPAIQTFVEDTDYEVVGSDRLLALAKKARESGLLTLELFPHDSYGNNIIQDFPFLQADGMTRGGASSLMPPNPDPLMNNLIATDTIRGGAGTAADPRYREASGSNYFFYEFNTEDCSQASTTVDIGGGFEIRVSADRENWTTVHQSATAADPRAQIPLDLTSFLPAVHLYLRLNARAGGALKLYNVRFDSQ